MTATPRTPAFRDVLHREGLHNALAFLNRRVGYRFTGLYCFDGPMLHNICLYDRLEPSERGGGDTPLRLTWCSITGAGGNCLEILDGRRDPRFPWMQGSSVISYVGTPVFEPRGEAIGTLCHFDVEMRRIDAGSRGLARVRRRREEDVRVDVAEARLQHARGRIEQREAFLE